MLERVLLQSHWLKDETDHDYEEFLIENTEACEDSQDQGTRSNLRMTSCGPFKLHLPMLPCDASLKIMLERLPSQYQLTFSENNDQVSIVVDLHGKDVPMNQVTEMILADMKRAFGCTADSSFDSGPTSADARLTTPWHNMLRRWSPTIFRSLWARHPLAEKQWYKQLKNAVYTEVNNCHRKSKYTGIVLFFITPNVHNQYTNLEMPGLTMDLYLAYRHGCTPFFENGKEVIPYKYIECRRCGIDNLCSNLKDISNKKKAASIVSCSEEDWKDADSIARKAEATWLAKRVTDQE